MTKIASKIINFFILTKINFSERERKNYKAKLLDKIFLMFSYCTILEIKNKFFYYIVCDCDYLLIHKLKMFCYKKTRFSLFL